MKYIVTFVTILILAAFAIGFQPSNKNRTDSPVQKSDLNKMDSSFKVATFAGGCFWCVEADFEKVDGVIEAISGYTGGHKENPTYKEVTAGVTGHTEAVQVIYDPEKVSYAELLEVFWRQVNPTDPAGQFVDRGSQYRTAIFYHDDEQKQLALESRMRLENSARFDEPIVTEITRLTEFYKAEDYHQNYYKKNALRYKFYRSGSGRDQFLKKVWGSKKRTSNDRRGTTIYAKPADEELRKKLTSIQYKVTQRDGTEPPFNNEYWNNKKAGIYVDIVSGEPLFSSRDKFVSGTGWPSFTRPLVPENIVEKQDRSLFMVRTEVRSKYGDSHLGHVFADGPLPAGLRYCINSAALRFIAKEDLKKEGYAEFANLFPGK